jgi:hypothetical protein
LQQPLCAISPGFANPRKRAVRSEPLRRGPRQTTAIRREPRHVRRRSRVTD